MLPERAACAPCLPGGGSGLPSSTTAMMRSTPASMPGGELALREQRRDGFADDAARGHVGQHAFEAVADLDAHALVVLGDEKIAPLSSPFWPIFHASATRMRVLLDRFRRGRRHDQHGELIGRARFPVRASLASSAWRSPADSVPVRSVTRAGERRDGPQAVLAGVPGRGGTGQETTPARRRAARRRCRAPLQGSR